tara:strand:+ start:4944 stop:5330 length:387 start_codon:yes stop_codon:yes gene_type:complete
MEQKNDFIEREIQKITLFIRSLISKIVKGVDLNTSIQTLDKELKGKLDFGFFEILGLNEEVLKKKINGVDILILEELLNLFYEIDKKELEISEINNLSRVCIILIDEIENKSRVFSFERQDIKNYFKS